MRPIVLASCCGLWLASGSAGRLLARSAGCRSVGGLVDAVQVGAAAAIVGICCRRHNVGHEQEAGNAGA